MNGGVLYHYTRGETRQPPLPSEASRFSALLPADALKHPGGVVSMTRDRGYPDWLVLSARLLWAALQARLHWYKIYMFWSCLACGYV